MASHTLLRRHVVAPVVSCALLVIAFAGVCAPRNSAHTEATLRVMTWNIAAGGGDLDRIADVIRSAHADLVALQEVDVHWSARSAFADQATRLGEVLQMEVCYAPIYHLPGVTADAPPRQFGVALLSRHPMVRCDNRLLTRLSTQDSASGAVRMPGLLDAEVDVGGRRTRVFNTHLDYRPDPAVRRQQVTEMLDYIGNATLPVLLAGDLNAPPDAPELASLFGALHDVWPTSKGSGFTYPASAPAKRIDYVLVSSHFRVIDAVVTEGGVSDHRAVVAAVGWKEE